MDRRKFLSSTAAVTAGLSLPLPFRILRQSSFAEAVPGRLQNDKVVLVIFQRGGADGLSTLVPTSDSNYALYRSARQGSGLVIPKGQLLSLGMNDRFMLHPAMRPLMHLWNNDELAFLHGAGSTNRTRSHFAQQDLIEAGTPNGDVRTDGYLNRILSVLNEGVGVRGQKIGMAVQGRIPYALRGTQPSFSINQVNDLKALGQASSRQFGAGHIEAGLNMEQRLNAMFRDGDTLGRQAIEGHRRIAQVDGSPAGLSGPSAYGPDIGHNLREVAKLLASNQGVKVVATEVGGWDNHISQGVLQGPFNSGLEKLASALDTFSKDAVRLGFWNKLVVVVMTEFGRRVAGNGTAGTDHGRGGVMMVMGGKVRGGHVKVAPADEAQTFSLAPAQLDEGDVRVQVDYRVVMSEIFRDHLGLTNAEIRQEIFPGFGQLGQTCNIYKGG